MATGCDIKGDGSGTKTTHALDRRFARFRLAALTLGRPAPSGSSGDVYLQHIAPGAAFTR